MKLSILFLVFLFGFITYVTGSVGNDESSMRNYSHQVTDNEASDYENHYWSGSETSRNGKISSPKKFIPGYLEAKKWGSKDSEKLSGSDSDLPFSDSYDRNIASGSSGLSSTLSSNSSIRDYHNQAPPTPFHGPPTRYHAPPTPFNGPSPRHHAPPTSFDSPPIHYEAPPTPHNEHHRNAEDDNSELFFWLPEGVQLVFIEDGITRAQATPSSLAIFKLDKWAIGQNHADNNKPTAILQIDTWTYPLVPRKTMILKNEQNMYILPSLDPAHPNLFYGIVLPRGLDRDLEQQFVYALQQFAILHQDIEYAQSSAPNGMSKRSVFVDSLNGENNKTEEPKYQIPNTKYPDTIERFAKSLIQGSQYLAPKIQDGADRFGKFLAKKGDGYRAGMTPTSEPVKVNPAVQQSAVMIQKGGKFVAKGTGAVLNKLGDAGIYLGRAVAKNVNANGQSTHGKAVKSATTVVAGGAAAFSTIWMALEEASKTLMRNVANETVKTVQIRYGDEASRTTQDALRGIGHAALATYQVAGLGPRAIAGRVAKKAGLQFVKDMDEMHKQQRSAKSGMENYQQNSNLAPHNEMPMPAAPMDAFEINPHYFGQDDQYLHRRQHVPIKKEAKAY